MMERVEEIVYELCKIECFKKFLFYFNIIDKYPSYNI